MAGAQDIIYAKWGLLAGPKGFLACQSRYTALTRRGALPVTRVSHWGGKCRQRFCSHLSPQPLLKPHKLSIAALIIGQVSEGQGLAGSQWNDCRLCLCFS